MDAGLNAIFSFGVRGVAGLASGRAMMEGLGQAAEKTERSMRSQAFATGFFVRAADNLGRSLGALTDEYGRFDKIVAYSRGLMGATNPEVERLVNTARTFRGTEHGPHAIAEAILELNRAGIEGNETFASLKTTLDVATVAEWNVAKAAEAVANVQHAWGTAVTTNDELMNKFANTANKSTFQLGTLVQAMTLAQGASKIYGQSLDETLTAMAILPPITGANSKAGTAWAAALRSMGNAKKQAKLHTLGVEVKDATGEYRKALDVFTDFIAKTEKYGKIKQATLAQDIFGERGSRAIAATMTVLEQGTKDINGNFVVGKAAIEAWRAKISDGKMTLEEVAKLSRDNLPMAWQAMKNMMINTLITFGERIKPQVMWIIDRIKEIAGGLEQMFKGTLGTIVQIGVNIGIVVGGLKLASMLAGTFGMSRLAGALAPGALAGAAAGGGMLGGLSAPGAAVTGWLASKQAALRGTAGWAFRAPQTLSPVAAGAARLAPAGWAIRAAPAVPAAITAGFGAASAGAGVAAGALGVLGSVAGALLNPLTLLVTAFWGLSKISDMRREQEEKELKQQMQLVSTAENFGSVAQGLAQSFTQGQFGVNAGILKQFTGSPKLGAAYINAVMEANKMFEAKKQHGLDISNEAVLQAAWHKSITSIMQDFQDNPALTEKQKAAAIDAIRNKGAEGFAYLAQQKGVKGEPLAIPGQDPNAKTFIDLNPQMRSFDAMRPSSTTGEAASAMRDFVTSIQNASKIMGDFQKGGTIHVEFHVDGFKAAVAAFQNKNPAVVNVVMPTESLE